MLTLAIESSGKSASVALVSGSRPPVERSVSDSGRRHAQTLVSEIDTLFREFRASVRDCDLVAVSIGPGSFTGLRVGVVAAKTLAYATGSKLVAVDTFEAIAGNSPADVSSLHVLADAQRGGLFAGRYSAVGTKLWERVGRIEVVDSEEWVRSRTDGDVISGSGIEKIRKLLPASVRVLADECWTPSATTIARIGISQFEQGAFADCFTLEPFYLRSSAAEEKAAQGQSV